MYIFYNFVKCKPAFFFSFIAGLEIWKFSETIGKVFCNSMFGVFFTIGK